MSNGFSISINWNLRFCDNKLVFLILQYPFIILMITVLQYPLNQYLRRSDHGRDGRGVGRHGHRVGRVRWLPIDLKYRYGIQDTVMHSYRNPLIRYWLASMDLENRILATATTALPNHLNIVAETGLPVRCYSSWIDTQTTVTIISYPYGSIVLGPDYRIRQGRRSIVHVVPDWGLRPQTIAGDGSGKGVR